MVLNQTVLKFSFASSTAVVLIQIKVKPHFFPTNLLESRKIYRNPWVSPSFSPLKSRISMDFPSQATGSAAAPPAAAKPGGDVREVPAGGELVMGAT